MCAQLLVLVSFKAECPISVSFIYIVPYLDQSELNFPQANKYSVILYPAVAKLKPEAPKQLRCVLTAALSAGLPWSYHRKLRHPACNLGGCIVDLLLNVGSFWGFLAAAKLIEIKIGT